MTILFEKYQGAGNDFIIINNFEGLYDKLTPKQVKRMCDRRYGIGADGLMLYNKKEGYDFEMVYYNADGGPSSMCGNGGRCIVKYARTHGVHKTTFSFLAVDGPHTAEIDTDDQVKLRMKDVDEVEVHSNYFVLNTGSPHFVTYVEDLKAYDTFNHGREIRNRAKYKEKGINVNFVEHIDDDIIYVRTYERGVEDETLSCGTGVTAAALVSAHNDHGFNTVEVQTPGGKLTVEYDKLDDNHFNNIWLIGPGEFVFKGTYEIDTNV